MLLNATLARFHTARDPDGNPWAPLNPLYAETKQGPGILRERGGLTGSIVYQVSGDTVSIGSNRIYAAVRQRGAVIVPKNAKALHFMLGGHPVTVKPVTIPARPHPRDWPRG